MVTKFFILPLQGVKLYIVPFNEGGCPGLFYFAPSGRKAENMLKLAYALHKLRVKHATQLFPVVPTGLKYTGEQVSQR